MNPPDLIAWIMWASFVVAVAAVFWPEKHRDEDGMHPRRVPRD